MDLRELGSRLPKGRGLTELLRRDFLRLGLDEGAVQVATDEVEALRRTLAWARPGDFVALLVHVDEEGVRRVLAERGKTNGH